jgi:3-methyladenine DNA glycosylase/8-oxoguanine DNA glycosylase
MQSVLTTDHPAWQTAVRPAVRVRTVRARQGLWLATWGPDELALTCLQGPDDAKPETIATQAGQLPAATPAVLRRRLAGLGASRRMANPWLWDALTTAILRQVVRAAQARKLYHAWCHEHGTAVDTEHGTLAVVPDPETVLGLSDDDFTCVGTAFHRTALQSAARAYLDQAGAWEKLSPADLATALVDVRRIGPWTASAAAADFTGDFSVYPHSDLAVRTWAARIDPDHDWPDTDKAFGRYWLHLAQDDAEHLHALTLLTLTWGAHARTTEHRD